MFVFIVDGVWHTWPPRAIVPQSQKGWCTGTSVIKYRLEVAVKKKGGHKPPPCCAACYWRPLCTGTPHGGGGRLAYVPARLCTGTAHLTKEGGGLMYRPALLCRRGPGAVWSWRRPRAGTAASSRGADTSTVLRYTGYSPQLPEFNHCKSPFPFVCIAHQEWFIQDLDPIKKIGQEITNYKCTSTK